VLLFHLQEEERGNWGTDMAQKRTKREYMAGLGVAQAVAAHATGVSFEAVAQNGEVSDPKIVRARQLAMYLARMVLKLGLRDTARAFQRAHPTVAHACRRIEEAREDPVFDRTVEWLEMLVRRAAGVAA
jgi:chromosomal replication initiation ATPase DnaA